MEREWLPWRVSGYHGEGVVTMEREWLPWRVSGYHGE